MAKKRRQSKDNTLLYLAIGIGGYYLLTRSIQPFAQPSVSFSPCTYPDGSTIQVPAGNACPNNPAHGGQSMMLMPGVSPQPASAPSFQTGINSILQQISNLFTGGSSAAANATLPGDAPIIDPAMEDI